MSGDLDTDPRAAVRLDIDGAVGVITLARADALNSVNDPIRFGLVRACRLVANDPAIRAVILRAEGERSFSVGADIKEVRPALSPDDVAPPPADRDFSTAIAALTKPVIAAIHGFCLGAGLEIALTCDIRIAAAGASFALPEVNLGLIPGAGGTQRLARVIGVGRALDMMLTGERIDAEKALSYGLVTRVTATRAELDDVALKLARILAAKAPLAITALKEAVAAGVDSTLGEGLARERELFVSLQATEDRLEAAEAFKAKRAPVFVGR